MSDLLVEMIPVLSDNYVYVIHNPSAGATGVVDPAVAEPVLAKLDEKGWTLDWILSTHHHADHTAGNLIGDYLGGALNPLEKEGQVEASRNTQIAMVIVDNAGICLMASFALVDPAGAEAMLEARFGKNPTYNWSMEGSYW